MGKATKLDDDQVRSNLERVPQWSIQGGKLHREIRFADFVAAFGFMTSVAIVAQAQDHHPEWSNVYNRVTIDLTTHDVNGISENDFRLAEAIDRLAVSADS